MTGRGERRARARPVRAADLAGAQAHDVLAGLRAHRPVAWIADLQAWLVTSHDLAVQVLRNPSAFTVDDPRFSTARVVGPSMLSLDGAEHRRHRTPFVAPFRRSQVSERFGAEIESLSHLLLDRWRSEVHCDLRTALAGPLAVAVVRARSVCAMWTSTSCWVGTATSSGPCRQSRSESRCRQRPPAP